MEGQSAWGFRRWSAGREDEGDDLTGGRGTGVGGREGDGGWRGNNGSRPAGGGAGRGVEPWIDVSSACPAGRERLRPDILSFSVSLSLPILLPPSLPLSPSLSLSFSLSFPLLSSSVPLVSSGPLIRRMRGDNSSPSLSLDDSLDPPARSFTPPAVASRPPPIADRASLVSFPPMNASETGEAINFGDCRQAS